MQSQCVYWLFIGFSKAFTETGAWSYKGKRFFRKKSRKLVGSTRLFVLLAEVCENPEAADTAVHPPPKDYTKAWRHPRRLCLVFRIGS